MQMELGSVNEVPETYIWPSTDVNDHPISSSDSIPVVDLSAENVITQLGQACRAYGSFQLVGHDIPLDFLDRLESQLHRLFSLPIETKLKAAAGGAHNGGGVPGGYGAIPISNFFSKHMWSEGFTIAGSPLEHARKLWPEDPEHFCEVIEEYDSTMKELAVRLTRLMLLALDLNEHDMQCANFGEAAATKTNSNLMGAIRLNSYPPCPEPGRAMGMAAHSDSSLLTILYQNRVSGLQVLQSGPAYWAPVPARRGTLIVILGDLFQILSNGRFKSALHRAVVNQTEQRISSAYFFGPTTAKVSPAARLVGCNQGPCYRAVTWPEYRGIKAKLFQGALDSLKII